VYEKILSRWLAGKITVAQIALLVLCNWLTLEQGESIKQTPQN
jgi:hypothetical protein